VQITLPFNTSNRDHGADVRMNDCVTPFDSDKNYFEVKTTTPTSNSPDGYIQFDTVLSFNITTLNGTSYWNAFTDGTRGGWVQVCVETYLTFQDNVSLGNDDVIEKINFKNDLLNMSVSLTSDFEVDGINAEREDVTEEDINTDYSEFIEAYECEEGKLDVKVAGKIYNQGDEIQICVTDTSKNIVQVEQFLNLKASQDGNGEYNFIRNSLWNPEITTQACMEDPSLERRVCYSKIRALARFFDVPEPTDLMISGSVIVIHDGRRARRNLHMALSSREKKNNENDSLVVPTRRVQEGEDGSGDFKVVASLGSTDNSDSAASDVFTAVVVSLLSVAGSAVSLMV